MQIRVADNEFARAPICERPRVHADAGDRLLAAVATAYRHLPEAYRRTLAEHCGDAGLSAEICELPAGWNAGASLKSGREIFFAPHAVRWPFGVLFTLAAEELLHLYQAATGLRFATAGAQEKHVDGLMRQCGFDTRAVFDYLSFTITSRRVPDAEYIAITERTRYAL